MPDRFLRRPRPTHHVAVEEAGDRGIPSKQTSTIPWTSRQKGRNEMDLKSDGERPEAFRNFDRALEPTLARTHGRRRTKGGGRDRHPERRRRSGSVDADLEVIYGKRKTDKAKDAGAGRDADANKDAGSHDEADAREDANSGCEEGDAEEGDEADTSSSDEGDEDDEGDEEDEGNEADGSDDAKGDEDKDIDDEGDATASKDANTDNEGDADYSGKDKVAKMDAGDTDGKSDMEEGTGEGEACEEDEGEDEGDTTGATNDSLAAEEQAGRREETECKGSAATDNSDIADASEVLDYLA